MATRTLAEIETQVYNKLRESAADTHFDQTKMDSLINEAISFLALLLEYPRKTSSTQAVQSQATYPVPSDFLLLRYASFGDTSINGDIQPLQIVTEDTVRNQYRSYQDLTSQTEGRPIYIYLLDRTNFAIYPRTNADQSATGKKIYYEYIYKPATLTNASDSVDLPNGYDDLVQYYVLHLCYIALQNKDMAAEMFNEFTAKHKLIRSTVTKETREALAFMFGNDVDVDVTGSFNVLP